jgi:uncharacterized protein YndB with AHSA1/START domain
MDIDITKHIGAVTREVSMREHEGKPAAVIVATRTYDSDIDDVWDALTNPERIPRWFLPITGDLRVGGHYQLEGNAGGEITRCEPPRLLALTWGMHGSPSWVVLELSEAKGGATTLRLEHVAHVPEEMWQVYGPGAGGVGWELALIGLDQHLRTGLDNDAKEHEAWAVSKQGKAYARLASQGWARAAIAAGEDEKLAMAAAERTAEFYSGPHEH